ncbi:unnamed protein product [Haemonchus placei]|uniref:Ovule protein n=1 Tax=Haemonchus placei TaxID=6290 RepID=A0A0N4WZL7_HAEPC|nr:unnamed protein product [Haemonchus placei]
MFASSTACKRLGKLIVGISPNFFHISIHISIHLLIDMRNRYDLDSMMSVPSRYDSFSRSHRHHTKKQTAPNNRHSIGSASGPFVKVVRGCRRHRMDICHFLAAIQTTFLTKTKLFPVNLMPIELHENHGLDEVWA